MNKKLITFVVPCYNSASYMEKCLNSLVSCKGKDVEIIIVDDGSTDNTLKIAGKYETHYPSLIKVIHQENGGHGSAINTGLKNAKGKYFKVVDSDDWLGKKALNRVLNRLRSLEHRGLDVDLFITNFIYDKVGQTIKKVMSYKMALPRNEIFSWKEIKHFRIGQYILMHSAIYRTEVLRESGMVLPAHTFYVDNIFVYQPLPKVKNLYYMNVKLYHYFIGRLDQSVHESVMIGRLDQQIRVNRIMLDCCDITKLPEAKMRRYMLNYLEVITAISSILALKSGTDENLLKKKELWNYIRDYYPLIYRKLRWRLVGIILNLPGAKGRKIAIFCYKFLQKVYGFN